MAEWVARGRAHQVQGRVADAIPCFRRAARAEPQSPIPYFHLGEAMWQLGLSADAVGAWHRAAQLDTTFVPARQALSEAALLHGDFAAALAIAREAATAAPDDPRAAAAAVAAAAASHDPVALARSADMIAATPTLMQVPALANAYAVALSAPPSDARATLLHVLGANADRAPPDLLAVLAEHGVPMPASIAYRKWAQVDAEALRRIVMATASTNPPLATSLATLYGPLTASLPAPPVPLLWPRRTAGDALRIAWIAPSPGSPAWQIWCDALARANLPVNAKQLVLSAAAPDVVRTALATTPLAGSALLVIPTRPDIDTARALAARDCDVLIDAAGMSTSVGPLLAMRPARRILSLRTGAPEHRLPLVDILLEDGFALGAALVEVSELRDADAGMTVDALLARWDAAVALHRQGDVEAAAAGYKEILDAQPGWAPALQLTGDIARNAGRLPQARAAFEAALAAAPNFVEARISATELAIAAGDISAAVALASDGAERAPLEVGLWRVLGQAELARHDGRAAEEAFVRALGVSPAVADLHFQHGVALQMAGDAQGAARAWQRALTFDPDMVAADFNLAVLFAQTGNVDAAIAAYTQVLEVVPTHVAAYKSLGDTLFAAGKMEAWLANFDRFRAHCPTALPMAIQALEVGMHRADFALVESTIDGIRRDTFVPADVVEQVDCLEELLYLLLFFDVEPELVLTMARRYDGAAQRVYGLPARPAGPRRPGPIRVGYLSADLRNHVMGKMMWQAVEHHDRAQFDIFYYAMSSVRDEWTERFASAATGFTVVANLNDAAAAARIAADDLDILVDLATHTRGARPGILARKPARIQITHIASAGTLGMSAVDFKLTDHFADLPENQALQIERMLPMDGCVYPYRHVAPAAVHPFQRASLGIAADAVVIGAFVTPLKLTRRCLALWRDVLLRIPRAILAFSPANPAHKASYLRLARAAGIGDERLVFIPQGRDDAENQARYHVIDFVLDTMPFGGVNGTLEALDMQVPVVTLVGRRHGERTSWSILANLGVRETAAHSGREYVEIAYRLASDPVFAANVRADIVAGLKDSPLIDMRRHTRHLEAAYVRALAEPPPATS
ncbi:MAG: tetratricopeptide repeat protein [Betaproteobacteria bacterium]